MIKRILSIMIIAAVCLSLASCGCSMGGGDADVHVFYYTYSDPYVSSVRTSLDKKLEDEGYAGLRDELGLDIKLTDENA